MGSPRKRGPDLVIAASIILTTRQSEFRVTIYLEAIDMSGIAYPYLRQQKVDLGKIVLSLNTYEAKGARSIFIPQNHGICYITRTRTQVSPDSNMC